MWRGDTKTPSPRPDKPGPNIIVVTNAKSWREETQWCWYLRTHAWATQPITARKLLSTKQHMAQLRLMQSALFHAEFIHYSQIYHISHPLYICHNFLYIIYTIIVIYTSHSLTKLSRPTPSALTTGHHDGTQAHLYSTFLLITSIHIPIINNVKHANFFYFILLEPF